MALNRVWVVTENNQGKASDAALELLTKAKSLGGTVEAIAFGSGAEKAAAELGEYGASTVYAATDAAFDDTLAGGPVAEFMQKLVQEHSPELILMPGSYTCRDIAGRLAVKLDVPVIANGLDVAANGNVTVTSSIFGATQVVQTAFESKKPAIALFRPKSFAAEKSGGTANVVKVEATVSDKYKAAKVLERVADTGTGPKLEDAPVVISGGRGLVDPKNFELLHQLADLLHGAVGASRAVVDAGWVPYAMQVGQTGKTVKPTVYIACGISGAMQHTVGMKGAKNIIAINKDPDAPIFKFADLGVVGDTLKIIPQLIDELKARSN